MINKKFLQFLGTILVVIFHLWFRLTNTAFERFIVSISYIGVDLFFICSAYSLSRKEKIDYWPFVINRFKTVYFKFVVFTLVYAFILYTPSKYSPLPDILARLIKFGTVISGIELFTKGGGSFLWFVPAIMIFYFLFPLFINWKNRYKSILVLCGYIFISIIFQLLGYRELFIVLNRIPLILVTYQLTVSKTDIGYLKGAILTLTGLVLMYLFSFRMSLNVPFYDSCFLVALPLCIGITALVKNVKTNKVMDMIASASLEIYALQMMIGFKLVKTMVSLLSIPFIVNIAVIASISLSGIIINRIFGLIIKR